MNAITGKRAALNIFRAALQAADPGIAVRQFVSCDAKSVSVAGQRYRLADFDRIRVVGAGKASASMARALEALLGARISDGSVNVPYGTKQKQGRVALHPAGHPIPDQRGVVGARKIAKIARESGSRDLLFAVISGGASALLPLPGTGITLARKKQITRQLLASGATIHEINCVRKHISSIKGGRLAALAYPATLIALILSDVIGDDLDVIGSGPTVPDSKTCADAAGVLAKYGIAPPQLTETPKSGDPVFARVRNLIVGSNRLSIDAARQRAKELGYQTVVLSTTIDGETRDIARMHAAIVREMLLLGRRRVCVLSGGETTVTLRGKGLGGRNQEFVLAGALALQESKDPNAERVTVFSAGTDGIDGPTDAAGAVANISLLRKARKLGLDPLQFLANNDSYHFFQKTAGLVKTGPTGTNVMDVRMLLID